MAHPYAASRREGFGGRRDDREVWPQRLLLSMASSARRALRPCVRHLLRNGQHDFGSRRSHSNTSQRWQGTADGRPSVVGQPPVGGPDSKRGTLHTGGFGPADTLNQLVAIVDRRWR